MSKKSYWNLLVLFGVLCQGIIGTFSETDTDESSDLLVRQKRVINNLQGGDMKHPIKYSPYVVAIKKLRTPESCVGVILTHQIALTAAKCVAAHIIAYKVYSGCARSTSNANSKIHSITVKRINTGHHPLRPNDGVALISVNPPFTFSINTHNIEFYEGRLQPGLRASVYGWGCNFSGNCGTQYPDWLRSITVPIISNEDCNILYLEHFTVTDSDICTLDAFGHQYCGANDAGAPLVLKVGGVDKLVGIHLWNGQIVGRSNPDVFVNLQHPRYKAWFEQNIQYG